MNLLLRTGSNISWIILSDFLTKLTSLLATIYLARHLGVEGFGIFSLSVIVASTLWPIVDLGVSGYGTREVARNINSCQNLLNTLNTLRLGTAIIVTLLATFFIYFLNFPETKSLAIIFGLAYLIGYALCPDWLIRGIEEMRLLFFMNLATSIFFIFTVLIFVHSQDDVLKSSFFRGLSFICGSIVGIIILKKSKEISFNFTTNISTLHDALIKTRHFLANRIISNMSQYVSFFLVTFYLSDHAIGLFAAPHRIYLLIFGGVSAISLAVFPILSDVYKNHNSHFKDYHSKLITYLLFVFLPGTFICLIFVSDLTNILFGSEYTESITAFSILFFSAPIIITKSIYTLTLSSCGHEKYIFRIVLYGMMLQLIVSITAIPYYGINAAAFSLLLGETLAMVLVIYKSKALNDLNNLLNKPVIALLLFTFLLFIINIFSGLSSISMLFTIIVSYTSLAFIFNLISLNSIRSAFNKDIR